jgi:peptidoglycan/LPS O-acetylase OafA/YrhL
MSVAEPRAESALARFLSLEPLDNRYPALHGLRVLAIISVVQFHVTWIFVEQSIKQDNELALMSLTVFFGMDLFFILSGFLIGSILLRSLDTSGTQNLARFYVRRISRTFPPYYAVLGYLALTTVLTVGQKGHLFYEIIYATNFVSLRRDDILMFWGWSLALEEQFYLLVPLLFFVLHRLRTDRARLLLLVLIWASALVVRLSVFYARAPWTDLHLYEALYFRPHTRFDTLICGIILAFVHARKKAEITTWLKAPSHRAMIAVPSLGCLWLLLRPDLFGAYYTQIVHVFLWGTVTSLMYFGWLVLLLHTDGFVHRALGKTIFRKIATLGYGVYLVHIPVMDRVIVPIARALLSRSVPMYVVWPISLTLLMSLSLGMGYVIHVFIEKPSLRIRERLDAALARRQAG